MNNTYKNSAFNDCFILYDIARSLAQDERKIYIRGSVTVSRLNLLNIITKYIDIDRRKI